MKKVRALAAGIAIMLAIFIIIYIATLYLKFNPDESKIEKGIGKVYQFFNGSQTARDYFRLCFFICLSAAVTLVFKKKPEWSVVSSFAVLSYALILYDNGSLSKRPSVITILCLSHAVGTLVSCAYADRFDTEKHCMKASLCSSAAALGMCGISIYYQNILVSLSDMTDEMSSAGVVFSNKLSFSRDLITAIYNRYKAAGLEDARNLVSDFSKDIDIPAFKNSFLTSIDRDQLSTYLTLAVIILFCAVFSLFLSKYSKLASVILSAIPVGYTVKCFLTDRLSTLTLALLVFTFVIFVSSLCAFDQTGKGHDTVYDDEENEEEKKEEPADPEEVYYS